jgi:DNA-binding MarR family transcriptional regulator
MNWDSSRGQLEWGALSGALGPHLRLLRNVMTSRILAALSPFGLPSGALSMLALIDANPGCSQTDLARQTGVTKSAVVAILDELERQELAERATAKGDRRRNELTLTPKGRKQLAEMQLVAAAQEEPIVAALSAEERATLIELLDRAYAAVESDSAGTSAA